MPKVVQNMMELVGDTPLVRLNKIVPENSAEIYVKLEFQSPAGSVKDRIAVSMIEEAEKKKLLMPGGTIIEASSGNTGIGLAFVVAVKGYKMVIVMPESASIERRKIMKAYGAELILTSGEDGMKGAIKRMNEMAAIHPEYFVAQQFDNSDNVKAHYENTGPEIVEAIESLDGKLDAFVAGVGTGGTISGAGEILKKRFPDIHIIAVEPDTSAVLSGREAGSHKLQGLGAGFVPSILNTSVYDEVKTVNEEDSFSTAKRLAKEEGLFVGISSGSAISAAIQVAQKLGKGKRLVVIAPSNGERYLSTPLFQ